MDERPWAKCPCHGRAGLHDEWNRPGAANTSDWSAALPEWESGPARAGTIYRGVGAKGWIRGSKPGIKRPEPFEPLDYDYDYEHENDYEGPLVGRI